MRIVIQRVTKASVLINEREERSIGKGMLILLGIEDADDAEDVSWLVKKINGLRIFGDHEGRMNLSLGDVGGQIMLISQFTLHASTRKGNRPSYVRAAAPEKAVPLYETFIRELGQNLDQPLVTGEFGAHMEVSLVNDGPVTIIIDSKTRE